LKAGTAAPSFSLPDLDGGTVSLEQYRGRRVLLVFSDPHCGPCDEVVHELAGLHRHRKDQGLALLVVSRGELEENRRKAAEHGVTFPVVIQPGWNVSKKYGIFATPVAFLIREDGVIENDVARGAAEIMALARTASSRKGGVLA
jgi:peroxiredoxin